jgi:hypothetical protein
MAVKLSIGLQKKIGLPDYGSLGASCHVEIELDGALLDADLERFHQQTRRAYLACAQAVNEELHRQKDDPSTGTQTETNGNGHTNGRRRDGTRKATASQVRALNAIASRQNLSATNLVQSRYGVDAPEDLSITEASELIDSLKVAGKGNGGRR